MRTLTITRLLHGHGRGRDIEPWKPFQKRRSIPRCDRKVQFVKRNTSKDLANKRFQNNSLCLRSIVRDMFVIHIIRVMLFSMVMVFAEKMVVVMMFHSFVCVQVRIKSDIKFRADWTWDFVENCRSDTLLRSFTWFQQDFIQNYASSSLAVSVHPWKWMLITTRNKILNHLISSI